MTNAERLRERVEVAAYGTASPHDPRLLAGRVILTAIVDELGITDKCECMDYMLNESCDHCVRREAALRTLLEAGR